MRAFVFVGMIYRIDRIATSETVPRGDGRYLFDNSNPSAQAYCQSKRSIQGSTS